MWHDLGDVDTFAEGGAAPALMTGNGLAKFAIQLRHLGMDAETDSKYGPKGIQQGLGVGFDFYPLWELTENHALIDTIISSSTPAAAHAVLESIRKKRKTSWTIAIPDA